MLAAITVDLKAPSGAEKKTVPHSPLPWRHVPSDNLIYSTGSNRRTIITISDEVPAAERDANAAFAVRCVNSHQALVDACERLTIRLLDKSNDYDLISMALIQDAQAALFLAKGRPK